MHRPLPGASHPFPHGSFGEALTFSLGGRIGRDPPNNARYPLTSIMAPKSSVSAGNIEDSETKVYNYDGDPLNRYPWAKHLEKHVYAHDARFRTHIQQGYHMTGHRTITQSVDHSTNLYHKNVAPATWANPACMGYWQYASSPPATTTAGAIPSDEAGNYLPAPHDCEAIDKALIEFILSTT